MSGAALRLTFASRCRNTVAEEGRVILCLPDQKISFPCQLINLCVSVCVQCGFIFIFIVTLFQVTSNTPSPLH